MGLKFLVKTFFFLFVFTVLSHSSSNAQGDVGTDTIPMILFQFQGGLQQPFGDMSDYFGNNAIVGFSFAGKTKKNWLWGGDFTFMFGDQVKNKSQIIQELRNSQGNVVGITGEPVNFLLLQRGYTGGIYTGKNLPLVWTKPKFRNCL